MLTIFHNISLPKKFMFPKLLLDNKHTKGGNTKSQDAVLNRIGIDAIKGGKINATRNS